MPLPATTDIFAQSFAQTRINQIKQRAMAANLEWPQGGFLPCDGVTANVYAVSAVMADGETALSSNVSCTIATGASIHPMNGAAFGSGIKLTWNPVTGAQFYRLYKHLASVTCLVNTTATTWTDNGTNAGYTGLSGTGAAGVSSTAPPTGLTAASLLGAADYQAQVGDDAHKGADYSWYNGTATSGSGQWQESPGDSGIYNVGEWTLSQVAAMQIWLNRLAQSYADPSPDASTALRRMFLDLNTPGSTTDTTTVLDSLMSLTRASGSGWTFPADNVPILWRRQRPREIPYLTAPNAVYDGLGAYGTPTTSMRAYYYGIAGAGPRQVVQWTGSQWAVASDQTQPADILDSNNAVGSGNELPPGVAVIGDYIGPWIYDQIDQVLSLMTRTGWAGTFHGGSPFVLTSSATSGQNLSTYIVTVPPDVTVPGTTPSSMPVATKQFQIGGGSSPAESSAAAALSAASGAAAANAAGPPINDSNWSTQYPNQTTTITLASGQYYADVQVTTFRQALYSLWEGAASTVSFLLAAQAPGSCTFVATSGVSIPTASLGPSFQSVTWNIFDTQMGSAGSPGTYKTCVSADYNHGLAPTPASTTGYFGQQIVGYGYVVDWTFTDGSGGGSGDSFSSGFSDGFA